jgi:hypothetical protein
MKKTVLTPYVLFHSSPCRYLQVPRSLLTSQWSSRRAPTSRSGALGVEVGERDRHRHRDQDWRRYHRDRAEVVINTRHRHHDRDHDRD